QQQRGNRCVRRDARHQRVNLGRIFRDQFPHWSRRTRSVPRNLRRQRHLRRLFRKREHKWRRRLWTCHRQQRHHLRWQVHNLQHYSVESPEVLNAYSGKVTLDGTGQAVVDLPYYFAKINKDPRYTLTAVGAPMPNLHIADEIDEYALNIGASAEPSQAVPPC